MCSIINTSKGTRKEMITMTMAGYINKGDLEGAYERYQETNKTWKSRWWEVVEKIYNSAEKWAQEYIIDSVARTLTKIVKKISKRGRPRKFFLENVMTFNCEAEGCGAYIVQHFDSKGESMWIKPGKADDAKRRMAEHFQKDYRNTDIATGTCLGWFPCKNEDHALAMEDVIRAHFKSKGHKVSGNDKFPTLREVTEEDFAILKRKSETLATLF